METKEILFQLRNEKGLSQEELATQLFVTRQAVSRWETGETIPNNETLKRLSRYFHVSINTLLGSPQKLICQCCGMPLDDSSISREPDGTFNEEYCKWCYDGTAFLYHSVEELTDFLVEHMPLGDWTKEEARRFFEKKLPTLKHWRSQHET